MQVHFILRLMALGLVATTGGIAAALAQAEEPGSASTPYGSVHKHHEQRDQPELDDKAAPKLLNLGMHTFPVSTRNKLAQKYINQGLNLSYAFNHAEAGRSFREAARLDPSLAMAYWGQALVLGSNINAAMAPENESLALELVRKASSLHSKASPSERALVSALEKRYSGNAEQRKANDKAYADAMRGVHEQFGNDLDIAMLYVESMMDLNSWGYWMRDGYPLAGTAGIVALTVCLAAQSKPSRRGAFLHTSCRVVQHARAGGESGRYAAYADASCRASGTHAIAHLSAGGQIC